MQHKLSEVNVEAKTAICSVCGLVRVKFKGKYGRACWNQVYAGVKRYRARSAAYRAQKKAARKTENGRVWNKEKHRRLVKMVCERCGFKARSIAQMDGHHKDGNHSNNEPSNVESLCACCHRLEHLPEHMKTNDSKTLETDVAVLISPAGQKAVEAKETPVDCKPEVRLLLDSIVVMDREMEELREALEQARSANVDANGAYWKARAIKAEQYAAAKDQST